MKKALTVAIVTGLMGLMAAPAMADPHFGHGGHKAYKEREKAYKEYRKDVRKYHKERNKWERERDRYDDRRYRPVYQVRPNHQWRRGDVLDRSYRGQGYWVNDYRQYPRLYAPAKNQRWVRVDNDYILVNTLSNVIVSILTGR